MSHIWWTWLWKYSVWNTEGSWLLGPSQTKLACITLRSTSTIRTQTLLIPRRLVTTFKKLAITVAIISNIAMSSNVCSIYRYETILWMLSIYQKAEIRMWKFGTWPKNICLYFRYEVFIAILKDTWSRE